MSSLKIAVKMTQLSDLKVKLKIEIENTTKMVDNLPREIIQNNISEPFEADSTIINHSQAKIPDVALQSGSFWNKLLPRLKFWRRN